MSRLCLRCATIIEEAFADESRPRSGHHQSFLDFKKAVDEGCYLCIRMWRKVDKFKPSLVVLEPACNIPDVDIRYLTRPALVGPTQHESDAQAIGIQLVLKREKEYTGPSPGEYCISIPTAIAERYLAPFTRPNASLKRASTEQAREWLSSCLSSHRTCCRTRTADLPTRLVAVERTQNQLCARVCNSNTLPPHSEYLNLSHIWGKYPILTLKEDNIQRLKESIPIEELPQVFQDAILITHDLGYSYLWIDSLCIIQDSDGGVDWLIECPRMHRVYGNSICNLAATGFESGQEGLFPQWQSHEIIPPRFERRSIDKDIPHASYCLISSSEWAIEVNRAPLHNRGWVFQEQIMAPRILHFTKKQLYWECHAVKASEVFPDQFPPYGMSPDSGKNQMLTLSTLGQQLGKDDLYREWLYLVQEYSRAGLTRPKDKLPALSGLARAFSNRLQDGYLAGLWRNDLLRGILWHGTAQATAITTYRAPSWSWASVDGLLVCAQLVGLLCDWEPLAHILSAETIPLEDRDVTGQLVSGTIRISGPLREVAVEGNLEKYSHWFNFKSPFTPGICDSTTRQATVFCSTNVELNGLSIYPSFNE